MSISHLCLTLDGEWELREEGKPEVFVGRVPGTVQTDLMAAGVVAHLHVGENAEAMRWIGDRDWRYRRTFELSAEDASRDDLTISFEGIDTLGEVFVNGVLVGRAENMYRAYRFALKDCVRVGANEVEVVIRSATAFVRECQARRPLRNWGTSHFQGIGHLRKAHYHFGWDWAPPVVPVGIWKSVSVVRERAERVEAVRVEQDHSQAPARVHLTVGVDVAGERATGGTDRRNLVAVVTMRLEGAIKAVGTAEVTAVGREGGRGTATVRVSLTDPELWWPRGLGRQPLYEIEVELLRSDVHEPQHVVDRSVRRVGLRDIRLIERPDEHGTSFYFEANGLAFMAMGGNWIPADCFPHRITRDRYRRLVAEAAEENCNMLRVWGGGLYESNDFMDACDELGVCVWHDFMFSCSTYPTADPDFLTSVRQEAVQAVRRLQHHASLVLWCGNNELEEGLVGDDRPDQMPVAEYDRLFVDMLGGVVATHAPGCPYIRSSGHTPGARRDRDHTWSLSAGDAHLWWRDEGLIQATRTILYGERAGSPDAEYERVFNAMYPVSQLLDRQDERSSVPRFCSELGRPSFPVMETIREFASEADFSPTSAVMEYHQQSSNARLLAQIADRFEVPMRFEDFVTVSQIWQGEFFRKYVEAWRQSDKCMGALFWCFNDCWPAVEWSQVDYSLRRKASFYVFRRFYAPLLVSACEVDPQRGGAELEVFVSNNGPEPVSGEVEVRVAGLTSGEVSVRHLFPETVFGRGVTSVGRVRLGDGDDPRETMVGVSVRSGGRVIARGHLLRTAPKRLRLREPGFDVRVLSCSPEVARVAIRADRAALWCEVSLAGRDCGRDLRLSDNYFHLEPGDIREIDLADRAGRRSEQVLASSLRVRSFGAPSLVTVNQIAAVQPARQTGAMTDQMSQEAGLTTSR